MNDEATPAELAKALTGLMTWASENTVAKESIIRQTLSEHFARDPAELPVVSRTINRYEHPNFQVALERWAEEADRGLETIGLSTMGGYRMGLAELARKPARGYAAMVPEPGPIEYMTVEVGAKRIVCVESGLFLAKDRATPMALLLKADNEMHEGSQFGLEIMAPERSVAEELQRQLDDLMARLNVYRGEVLTFAGGNPWGGQTLSVLPIPDVGHEQIVLPDGVLSRIERQTIGFANQAARLKEAGRHIRRGLLLYGPPGTGKTLTAMYLAKKMPERTVLVLSGQAIAAIGDACDIARTLQPALVILEDVDLVAMERSHYTNNPLLFELLNAMDGVAEDADIIFLLTTNRVSVLEPALASRPGRIDEAIELPLPDAAGRGQLFDLYGRDLNLDVSALQDVIGQTEGASPAFIRELCRRAALLAAEADAERLVVTPDLIERAHEELMQTTQAVTQSLLGAEFPTGTEFEFPEDD